MRFLWSMLFLLSAVWLSAQTQTNKYTVYLFLLEDCQITRAYTDRLGEIYEKYSSDQVHFVGLFANPVSEEETVKVFAEKYELPFSCTTEGAAEKARAFEVRVTPEVVLYDEVNKAVKYQGRIDNMYERVGIRRRVVTSFELEAALHAVLNNKSVPIPRTDAVGCYLPLSQP